MFISRFVKDVTSGNAEGFMQRVERFFDGGDYQLAGKAELYFLNTLWVLFKLLGLCVDVERHTTDGRMDILVRTPNYVYILELKIDQSADISLNRHDVSLNGRLAESRLLILIFGYEQTFLNLQQGVIISKIQNCRC